MKISLWIIYFCRKIYQTEKQIQKTMAIQIVTIVEDDNMSAECS